MRTGAWATLSFEEPGTSKSALKAKSSFPGVEKEERDAEKCYAPRISCSPFPGESWHLAVRIDDPDPVVVASLGLSLSQSALNPMTPTNIVLVYKYTKLD